MSPAITMAFRVMLVGIVVMAWPALLIGASLTEIQEHARAMLRDSEDMVMHGGMGDGKAILHHCQEVTKHAEVILRQISPSEDHGKAAVPFLEDAIKHCQRVADLGEKVDPGAALNPATKARTAVREAAKHLLAIKSDGVH
jgi:hypothetical protein